MSTLTTNVIAWVRDYLNSFGGNTKTVIGISGGKDSSIAAAICVAAVGKDRVIGVLMPDGEQKDIDKSYELVNFLKIKHYLINIGEITKASKKSVTSAFETEDLSSVLTSNMPARIRMTTLYNVAAQIGDCRVVNTCNRSEDYVGYSTKFGDAAGDFSPLSNLCVSEVKSIGYDLNLPVDLIEKIPSDGLCGKSDEENLGFSYATLDKYLLEGVLPEKSILDNIERRHKNNLHKLLPMPSFKKD